MNENGFETWYQVHFLNAEFDIWEVLKEGGEVTRYWNRYVAQKKADELCTTLQAKDAFVCQAEKSVYCCVVTRQLMINTQYKAILQ